MYTFFSRKMIIERNNKEHEVILEDLEKDVKNKWRWEWIQACIDIDDPAKKYPKLNWRYGSLKMVVKDHIKKVDIPGGAWCSICSKNITYSDSGLGNTKQHLTTKKHLQRLAPLLSKQQLLPGTSMPEAANSMYGAPAVYSSSGYIPPATTTPVIPQVHILDRVANMEAMNVAFIAEHNLSLSEELIELSKELSRDTTALKSEIAQDNILL